jgi:hypothetical protein
MRLQAEDRRGGCEIDARVRHREKLLVVACCRVLAAGGVEAAALEWLAAWQNRWTVRK